MWIIAHALLMLLLTTPPGHAHGETPSIAERERLEAAFTNAPSQVQGGAVKARWLDDGSSFLYKVGRRTMWIDPAGGAPRLATREDLQREGQHQPAMRAGSLYAAHDVASAKQAGGILHVTMEGSDEDLELGGPARESLEWVLEPTGWSADGKWLAANCRDTCEVHQIPIVDDLKAQESLRWVPYVKSGSRFPTSGLTIFKMPDGQRIDVDTGPARDQYLFNLGWREDGSELLYLRLSRDAKQLDLLAANPANGESRVIISDTQKTFVAGLDFVIGGWRQYFTAIEGTDEFLWLSERDGWRHVYHYNYAGEQLGRVTRGEFLVQSVVAVDPARGRVFLMANAESRPYDTHFYRGFLDGGKIQRLTAGDGEHHVQLSPSKLWFVDNHSSLDRAPVSELRSANGNLLQVLDKAVVTGLAEIGWSPPEAFVVKAADGETDLHGVLYKPSYFDPSERYPVIDVIYSGPFMTIVPNEFCSPAPHARRAQALAQMGFVTFLLDPRGTTERGKQFQDATYARIGELEIPDRVAALRQVAASRPYMDTERTGVYGHSWGGYFALRAMLTAPDVFQVGVASAPGELTEAAVINEPYMDTPEQNPGGYARGLNAPLAKQLTGKLMLLHGTADVNAPLSTTMRMVDALIKADKDFDLLILPGADHDLRGSVGEYSKRRVRDFFLEHLRDE